MKKSRHTTQYAKKSIRLFIHHHLVTVLIDLSKITYLVTTYTNLVGGVGIDPTVRTIFMYISTTYRQAYQLALCHIPR